MQKRLIYFSFSFKRPWIRTSNLESGSWIRTKIKLWIRIRTEAYADPQHCLKLI